MESITVRCRQIDETLRVRAVDAGIHPVAAQVIAGRTLPPALLASDDLTHAIHPELARLDHYDGLPDIKVAAERLASAVMNGETIALETDHDVDGVTSHAVLYRALVEHFGVAPAQLQSYIGHRLKDGYGLSDPVADRILAAEPQPHLVITADNGSSDELRIARLKAAGIDVIVTDHHELPIEGPPASALACVTPARKDSAYPDPCIAGCMVSWLLGCATRRALIDAGHLPKASRTLAGLLDYVAVGTVADCVSLARSSNNRAVVSAGLARINAGLRPCWRAAQVWLRGSKKVRAEDLAFAIGPRINARGRLDEAMAGVKFLLAPNDEEAAPLAALLNTENEARKLIERDLRVQAEEAALPQVEAGASGLVVWLPDGHPGVHGIVASRLVEAFGRPVACLSPKVGSTELVTGSVRGIQGIHIRDALQGCADALPGALVAFGGHRAAGGLTLKRESIDDFRAAFNTQAEQALAGRTLGPVVLTDGEIDPEHLTLDTVEVLDELDPYGREFEAPVFEGAFRVMSIKPVGDGTHLKLMLRTGECMVPGIWFRVRASEEDDLPVAAGADVKLVYRLSANDYRGERSLQLVVELMPGKDG